MAAAATAAPAPRKPLVPPAWERLQRAETRKLLEVEKHTAEALRRAARAATVALNEEFDRRAESDDASARSVAVLALLLLASRRLKAQVAARVRAGRERARRIAIARIRAELALGGIPVAHAHALEPRTDDDSAYADAAGNGYAAAWAGAAIYLWTQADRAGTSPTRAISRATELKDSNLGRIAATEIPRAYSDQHRQDAEALAEAYPDVMAVMVRQWDARLDACPDCAAHDGETTPIGQSFENGDEPGFMHPHCRCESSLVPATLH